MYMTKSWTLGTTGRSGVFFFRDASKPENIFLKWQEEENLCLICFANLPRKFMHYLQLAQYARIFQSNISFL